jgi:hypothetical protein
MKTVDNSQPDEPEDDDEVNDDFEFNPCSKCDGHDACEDFGCAIELGLGRMVKRDIPHGSDDWG